jgi:tripartite-type tricarboxylate transporter receptor subunit TctC
MIRNAGPDGRHGAREKGVLLFRLAIASAALAATLALVAEPASAAWPEKPIRFIVTFPPGGSTDFVARVLQPHLEKTLGQPIIVENRAGAGGVIGVDAAAKAPPDGYTIVLGGAGAVAINVALGEKMPYDPQRDLIPVTNVAKSPFIFAAPASLPENSLRDLIARAKANPATLSIGHGGNGTGMHLTALLLVHLAQAKIGLVPYRGMAPVTNDLAGGHIPLGVTDMPSAISLIRDGKIKALAVSTRQRFGALPDVPTAEEAGLPGFESMGWFGIEVAAGTPPEVVGKLNAAFVAALRSPDVVERFRSVGVEPDPTTPEQFEAFIRSEIEKWGKLMADVDKTK